jgi:mycothiol synthase
MRHILKLNRTLTTALTVPPNQNIDIATFVPSLHKDEWLALNNKIFSAHPDQGNWVMEDLENRMREPWFDPEGFFIATQNRKMVGFCWTKIHHDFVNQDPVGELYVIGVDPDFGKRGIGRGLAIAGINHLIEKHLGQVMLYVDADNEKALALYNELGFN